MRYPPFKKPFFILFLIILLLVSACAKTVEVVQQASPSVSVSPEAAKAPPENTPSPSPGAQASASESPAQSSRPPVLYLKPLYEQNSDLIGWLSIEGTVIDYPVMYSPEEHDFYLSHDFEKKPSKSGLLVMQADCDPYSPGTNLIIHGHKMKSGKMFGTLAKYKDKSYWEKHPVIKFQTLYAKGEYRIFAAFYSKVYDVTEDVFKYYHFLNANTKEELDDFIRNVRKLALYDTDVDVGFGDQLITLSTCSYHTKDGRFVVVAKKIN